MPGMNGRSRASASAVAPNLAMASGYAAPRASTRGGGAALGESMTLLLARASEGDAGSRNRLFEWCAPWPQTGDVEQAHQLLATTDALLAGNKTACADDLRARLRAAR